ncbi:MAG: NAD(P)/FAD-dependent oxidoreductase [Hahellaceae bacterium]|nr:NAD(P)/FAD-dependent oxidoreductase [Hahellaceae bacterium]
MSHSNPEHTDILVVGAGISGIGLAHYLQKMQPHKRFVILEARESIGGTWDLFRYPGIRSDSDLFTFGYEFKPWVDKQAIASADKILAYMRETVAENEIAPHIRFHQRVVSASWSSEKARWTVEIAQGDSGERRVMTCNWLFSAAGYYRYDEGYTPHFEGLEHFKGTVIHPQHWPEDLETHGKRIVVIGSGATAVTLVPALAKKAAHVTQLQRTPTYVMSLPEQDPIANLLRKLLPAPLAYALTRRKNIALARGIWRFCQRFPLAARRFIRWANRRSLPEGYPVDEHFNPPYNPWDQRLCAVPDGDLFKAIAAGKASIVTDRIETITERGITLTSGKMLEADIIVTATGLNLQLFGGAKLQVDGRPIDFSKHVAFKGMMLNDLPNFAFAIGYTNSSWTLKVGLVCEHFCRILAHMDQTQTHICNPVVPSAEMETRPILDFGAGYVQRAMSLLPRQGLQAPWTMTMNYYDDLRILRKGPVADDCLHFYSPTHTSSQTPFSTTPALGVAQ